MESESFVFVECSDDAEADAAAALSGLAGNSNSGSSPAATGIHPYARKKRCCQLCSHFAASEEELAVHVESAHSLQIQAMNAKKYSRDSEAECKYCGLVLNTISSIHDHARKEHLDLICQEWLLCETCQSYFPDQAELILHRNLSHAELKKPPGNDDCPFCGQHFENSSLMQEHANAEHKDKVSQSWQSCDRCSTYFPTPILLSRHKVQNHFHQMVSNKKSYMHTTNARKKLLEQHQLIRRNIEKAKQPTPPRRVQVAPAPKPAPQPAPQPVSPTASKPGSEAMMVQVHQSMNQDGVIIFKRADNSENGRATKRSATSGPKRSKKAKVGNDATSAAAMTMTTLSNEVATLSNSAPANVVATSDGYVYIVADSSDPTFVFQDVEESGNQISSIEMSGDCITFQVQADESAA